MKLYLGVDPGASGALVVLGDAGVLIEAAAMPTYRVGRASRVNVQALSGWLRRQGKIEHAYMERVGAMPGQGVSSMFAFGHSAGAVEGVIAALGIPVTLIEPQAWKRSAGLIGADKDASRTRAAQLYPNERDFDTKARGQALADAVFIARHGMGV